MFQSEETMVGKCLELLYILRQKTNQEYESFIKILQMKGERNKEVIGVLTMDSTIEGRIE